MQLEQSSRVRFLEQTLSMLQFHMALQALDLVRTEMCKEKGFIRYNGTDYYLHLCDVCQKLLNYNVRDENILTAALLHDLLEDVPVFTPFIIQREFNEHVAAIVSLVTKKRDIDYRAPANIIHYLQSISHHAGASLIKTADRIHNFNTLLDAPLQKRYEKAIETERFFIPFFKRCRIFYPRYASFFFEAKTHLEPLIWEIKEHYNEHHSNKPAFVDFYP